MPRSRKKKGKKGGKQATAPIPSTAPTDDSRAKRDTEASNEVEAATDATSPALSGRAGSEGKVLSKREKKDRKLAKAGQLRVPSSNPMFRRPVPLIELSKNLRLNVIGPDGTSVVAENVSILRHKMAKKAYAIIKQHEQEWDALKTELFCYGRDHNGAEVSRVATALLDGVDLALSDIPRGENMLILVLFFQIWARHYRCSARHQLDDYQGSIEDATEGLALLEAWGDNNEDASLKSDADMMRHQFLRNRGSCLSLIGDLELAEVDLRAACASIRLLEWEFLHPAEREARETRLDKCTTLLLKVMAAGR